jgi:phosphate-selective porin OprO/OprP
MINHTDFYSGNIATLFADAMHKHNGFSFMAEFAK